MKSIDKVYVLKSEHGIFVFSDVLETKEFYLVSGNNSDEFTVYNKKLYSCEIQDCNQAQEIK